MKTNKTPKNAVDPYQSDDYQRFLYECAKHCHCHCDYDICDSVLAGAPCEGRIRDVPDYDDEPDQASS